MERRLAAILAADVVGFSRLVEADEEGTLSRLAALRSEFIQPAIAEHSGTVVKLIGDGLLAEFGSVVDAARCAVAIQRGMAVRSEAIPRAERIVFRIGINLGDIVAEEGDIYGDGVNIASRLEAMAEPGGICISGMAFDHLKTKLDVALEPLGEQRLKNISEPVRVYRASLEPAAAGRGVMAGRSRLLRRAAPMIAMLTVVVAAGFAVLWWQPWAQGPGQGGVPVADKVSIAVLPFVNLSGDPGQDYFADGMTEELITDLAKFPALRVTARTSVAAYRDRQIDIRAISRELGVNYVLEGSVDKGGDTVRVTAQLIDGATGGHLWAERYDRALADVFTIRDDIRAAIVGAITGHTGALAEAEMHRSALQGPGAAKARDLYYQALAEFEKFDPEANVRARALLEQSIALDPNDAGTYAKLAWTHWRDNWIGWRSDFDASAKLAREAAEKAIAADSTDYRGHWALAGALRLTSSHTEAAEQYRRAFALNPNDPDMLADWGEFLRDTGRLEEAVEQITRAMELNPHYPDWYGNILIGTYFLLGRYEDVVQIAAGLRNPLMFMRLEAAAAYGHLGKEKEARAEIDRILAIDPDLTIAGIVADRTLDEEMRSQLAEGLRKAGLPE